MKIEQILAELDLQDKEPEVYIALLKTPGAQPASVIANRASLNRTTTYKALIRLVKKGLVTKTQRQGVICFFAEDPDQRLQSLLSKKRKNLDLVNEGLMNILPDLQSIQHQELRKPKIRYYEGVEGVRQSYLDMIKSCKTKNMVAIFAVVETIGVELQNFFVNEYVPARVKKGINIKNICLQSPKTLQYKKRDQMELRSTKFVSKKHFPLINTEVNLYDNSMHYMSFDADNYFAMIVEDKYISAMFKAVFNLLWLKVDEL